MGSPAGVSRSSISLAASASLGSAKRSVDSASVSRYAEAASELASLPSSDAAGEADFFSTRGTGNPRSLILSALSRYLPQSAEMSSPLRSSAWRASLALSENTVGSGAFCFFVARFLSSSCFLFFDWLFFLSFGGAARRRASRTPTGFAVASVSFTKIGFVPPCASWHAWKNLCSVDGDQSALCRSQGASEAATTRTCRTAALFLTSSQLGLLAPGFANSVISPSTGFPGGISERRTDMMRAWTPRRDTGSGRWSGSTHFSRGLTISPFS
mmetsp:Transcript_16929/g.22764  ORF Transcript_16929/g.22764 Transcript_16929/m.22764 type:complete len:270 (+) Transcript_16929:502-1311(+)